MSFLKEAARKSFGDTHKKSSRTSPSWLLIRMYANTTTSLGAEECTRLNNLRTSYDSLSKGELCFLDLSKSVRTQPPEPTDVCESTVREYVRHHIYNA